MSLDPRIDSLTERVAKLETELLTVTGQMMTLRATVDALSAIVYHREPPKVEVTVENVLDGLSRELKELVEVGEYAGEIRVRVKTWLKDKSKWATINKFLREKGLKWHSQGKESYWGNR